MIDLSGNQILNIFILLVPFAVLLFVFFLKRNKRIDVAPDRCAKAWERMIAFFIDVVLCLVVFFAIISFSEQIGFYALEKYEEFAFLLMTWLYFSVFESSSLQATLGKLFSGIIVTDLDGKRLSFVRATIRFISTLLSDMSLFIGYLTILFTKHKQGLHDMIANTLVLKKLQG